MSDDRLSSREALREGGSILKDAILNQYQAIIGIGVGAVSLIALSPLPALLWLGAELVLLPLIDSPPVRRLVHRRRLAQRKADWEAWRQDAIRSLKPERQARYRQMANLCQQIEANYLGLNGISQIYLTEQREKLDQVLTSCLHRMLALGAYERAVSDRRPEALEKEIAQLERELESDKLPERARAAVAKNIELKRTLLASLNDASGAQLALETELDSSYSVLEVLLQKSLSMRDPDAISAELDTIVAHAEESERSVREMESLMRSSGVDVTTGSMDRMAYPGMTTKAAPTASTPPRVRQR
jgi:hypothetical protein